MVPVTNTMPGHFREFQYDEALKKTLRDSCGDTALEIATAMSERRVATVAEMVDIYNDIYKAGSHHYPNHGGSTLWDLAREAEKRKRKIAIEWDYSNPFNHDWLGTLRQYAGEKPIVLFLTNANELVDAETGIGYSWRKPFVKTGPGLQGHFITVVSKSAQGYVCSDGANPQAGSRYAVYTAAVLAKSGVHGLLMLEMDALKPAGNVSGLSYKVDGAGNLTYEKGSLKTGFSEWVQTHKYTADLAIPDTSLGTESFCVFTDGRVLYWSEATGVVDLGTNCGKLVTTLYQQRKVA